jgi:cyclophilin family peptidyl-prolyl cis-trans isomerase
MMRKSFWKRLRSAVRGRRSVRTLRKHRFCRMEPLESRQLLTVTLPALVDQTLLAGAPLHLALNGSSSASNPVAYTVSVTNSQLTNFDELIATVPEGNPSLRITVNSPANGIQGNMGFQLFKDLAPETVLQITTLADSDFYNGLIFHRVIDGFMVQGGDPQGTGSGGPGFTFDDEFDPDLQFTSAGILAMANSGADTNGSQFFITTVPTRWLDFNHSIFGFLTQGSSILTQIENVSTNASDKPLNDVVMTDVSTFTDTQNSVLRLSVLDGTTGSATVTVTARDTVTNETASQTFSVTVQADTTNNLPFIWGPIDPVYTFANTPVDFDIFGYDVEDDPIFYSGSATTGNGTLTVDSELGFATYTPPSGATGMFKVKVNVGASSTTTGAALDTQTVTILVANATGNTPPVLTAASPSLGSIAANAPKTIELIDTFINAGTNTTSILDPNEDGIDLGIALTAVTGSGAWEYSLDSGETFQPVGTVSATSALLLSDLAQLRFTPTGTTGTNATITYRGWDMTSGAEGEKVNSTAGGSTSAFSTATDTATLTVTSSNVAPVLTAAGPSLGSTDENTAKTVDLTGSFINNGAGTTTITDTDTSAVVGGIALVGVAGTGTWAYSTDGSTFTSMGAVSAGSALLLPSTAKIRYTPDNANGETATITYRAWDTISGASGGRADLSASGAVGGSSAFSSATDTASLSVSSLNDAPVLTAANPTIGGTAQGTAKTFSLTGTFLNNGTGTTTITDPDTGATVGGIALTGIAGAGTWEYSTDGTTFTSVDTVAADSALLLPKTAQLRYTPSANSSETATITYRAWDTTTGTAGAKVDTTTNGAATAFSTTTDTASLSVGTATISGFVYLDNDNDGLRTVAGNSHRGLPGVVVRLLRKDASGAWNEVTGKSPIMTGADGSYRFEGVEPGTYRVQEDQPGDYLDGKETLGQVNGQTYGTAGSDYFEMECQADENGTEYNFGERGLRPEKVSLRMFLASSPPASEWVFTTNSLPTVDLSKAVAGTGRSTTYQNGGSPVAIAASDAEILDANSPMLASMGVTINNRLDGDSEKLEVDTSGTSLTSSFAAGVLTVRGVATPAVYQQTLLKVKYSNTAASPQSGDRSIDVVVNDGIADSKAAVATVKVVAPPAGYTITADDTVLNGSEAASAGFTFAGAQVGSTYNYTVTSSGGGTAVTGSGTVTSAAQHVTGINVSSLSNGTLTYSVTLTDANSNVGAAATATATLDKTAPSGYTITAGDSQINSSEATATSFTFAGAEVGATYNYSVTSSGGGTPVTGSGTVSSATQQITGINVSALSEGTLTYSVTLSDAAGNAGTAATATATFDKTAPTGYTIAATDSLLSATEALAAGFSFTGAQAGATYSYTVTSSGGGTAVTGSGTVSSATQQVTGINVSSLSDGTLTYSVTLADPAGNAGAATTATATLDKTAPSGYTIVLDDTQITGAEASSVGFTFAGAEVGATYGYTVSGGGGTPVTGTGTVTSATQHVTGINISPLPDGALTFSVTLTDTAGNTGSPATAAATLDNAPLGYTIAANDNLISAFEATAAGFTFAGAEVGATYNYTVTSSGGGTPVTGTGTVSSATQTVTGIDVSSLPDGTLTFNATLTDTTGNVGAAVTATTTLDTTAPTAAVTPDSDTITISPITFTVTFNEAVNGVGITDFAATGSQTGTLAPSNFQTVSATVYRVDVSGMASGENVTLSLVAAASGIADTAGNALTANASGTVAFDAEAPTGYSFTPDDVLINAAEAASTSLTFANAEVGATYSYVINSSGGGLPLTGSGMISSASHQVTGINVSSLPDGTLTYSVALTDPAGNVGAAVTATATLDNTVPTGYSVAANDALLSAAEATAARFTFTGAEAGTTYDYTVTSSGGGAPVTGSGTIASATQEVTGIDVSALTDGTLTYSVILTDPAGNIGAAATATATLDKTAPADYTVSADDALLNATEAASAGFTFAGAEAGATYNYTVTSSGGGAPVTGSGTVSAADQPVTGINVSPLPDGTLTYSVTLTDTAGNAGAPVTATATLDRTAPTATITPNGTAANSSPITFTVTFDEAVTGVDVADLAATGSVSGPLTLANFQALSATVYTVDVNGMASGENVALQLTAAGSGISDAAFNALAVDAEGKVTFDATAPTGYTIAADDSLINAAEAASTSFTFAGAEVGATYFYQVYLDGTPVLVAGSGTIRSSSQQVTGIDVSSLPDGILTYSVVLTDTAGNVGEAVTTTATLDRTAPSGYTIVPDDALIDAAEASSVGFTFAGAEFPANYSYTITSSGGGAPVTGSGTVASATEHVVGIDVSSLLDGDLTFSVVLTDAAGNAGTAATATATLDKTAPVATTTAVVNGSRIEFTVVFNEDVTDFDVDDVTATGEVTGALVVKDVTPNTPSSYRVRVEGMTTTAPGELVTLRSPTAGSVSDLAGNPAAVDAVFAQFDWVVV